MADIFISYSKADHALALKLSAFLEAEGWSVWSDKSLGAADLYRDEIMKQLAAARAVISIWTENSVRSDWVRAEAGRAKADGKLIPVKTADVAYADIPLPFGEMHTENLEASQLIRAAVVAQLAKPAVEPSAITLLAKGFKWELLTWVGIIGGALTLFTATRATLKFAEWARLLVESWKEWTHALWLWAFGWLGIHLSPEWSLVLSYLSFGSLLTIGQAIKVKYIAANQSNADKYRDRSFRLTSRFTWFCFGLIALGYVIVAVIQFRLSPVEGSLAYGLLATLGLLFPQVLIVLFARHAAVSVVLLFVFALTLVILPEADEDSDPTVSVALAWWLIAVVLPVILLSVAPAKAVSRRLMFLAIGLILLIALNELSKLAPKLHEWGL